MNLNKAFVLGNLTRDPEIRSLPSGQQVASFGVATNRFYTDASGQKKQEAEFHNIVCFGKLADISQRYLTKGSLVLIEGRIRTRNWQNQQGAKQYRTEIIADNLQLGPKSGAYSGSGSNSQYQSSSFSKQSNTPARLASQPEAGRQHQTPNIQSDIPIIEENAPPANFVNNESPTPEEKQDGEIDVKDIPF